MLHLLMLLLLKHNGSANATYISLMKPQRRLTIQAWHHRRRDMLTFFKSLELLLVQAFLHLCHISLMLEHFFMADLLV